MFKKISIFLEMIKFKLTIFALPFALMGAWLAAGGVPKASVFGWIIVAMVGARTCAMGFNRIVDASFDKANPRTAQRAIPTGAIKMWEAWIMVISAGGLFFFAAYRLNIFTLQLAPLALGLTLFYSFTKRFTSLCHLVLGLALAFSPLGGWVAVQGTLQGFPWMLAVGVIFWITGFDAIYACLDADFDRQTGLYSLPARLGRKGAFRLAIIFHTLAFSLFVWTGVFCHLGPIYFSGCALTATILFYQHLIVVPHDLSRIKGSFFSLNGLISLTLFAAVFLDLYFG